jgi:anaerobic magnesium-protoporphyrin IX monomethyl ester cyclase
MSRKSKRRPVVLYQPRDEGAWMPLGLLALGSHLSGEHVVVVDGRFDLAPEARVAELAVDASCLGVSVRTGPPLRDALRVSAAARAANPRLNVIWGGPHATYAPWSCLATGIVDACARGAGEEALAAALTVARDGGSLANVRGLLVKDGAMLTPEPPPEAEWAARARYSLLDVERHFHARGRRRLDYCASRGSREQRFRGLAADRVVAELGELAERHRLSEVVFRDEDFFADPLRAEAIAAGLLEAPARFAWRVGLRPEDVREGGPARLELLKRSGCRSVGVSVPPDVPARGPLRDGILEAGARLHEAGLAARFELTVSEPGPKRQHLAAAVSLARALSTLDHGFETPLRRAALLPPAVAEGDEVVGIETWIARAGRPWSDLRAERRLRRASFYLAEGQRAPGRGLGKHLLRMLSLLRTRLGYFGLDFERGAVEISALLRTGRPRAAPSMD